MEITKKIRLAITNNIKLYAVLSKVWRFINKGLIARIQYFFLFKNWDKKKKDGKIPLFTDIEIETLNICNGECSFCPVNKHVDPRKHIKMENEIFYKIIKELENLDYSGNVFLYSNNEPFIDTRIYDFIKYTKQHLKKATVIIYSNGTLLTVDGFKKAIEYLDELYIDNYNDAGIWLDNIAKIKDYYQENKETINCACTFSMRKQNEILGSKGGEAPNTQGKIRVQVLPCMLTHTQMVIRSDGGCSLCCNDPFGRFTLGNVHNNTLQEIWNSKEYDEIRNKLRKSRSLIEKCKYCDAIATTK